MPDAESHGLHPNTISVWLTLGVEAVIDTRTAQRLAERFGMPAERLQRRLTAESLAADAAHLVMAASEGRVALGGRVVDLRPRIRFVAAEHEGVDVAVSQDLPPGLATTQTPAVQECAARLRETLGRLVDPDAAGSAYDEAGSDYRWLRWRWRDADGYQWLNGRPDRPIASKSSFARETERHG